MHITRSVEIPGLSKLFRRARVISELTMVDAAFDVTRKGKWPAIWDLFLGSCVHSARKRAGQRAKSSYNGATASLGNAVLRGLRFARDRPVSPTTWGNHGHYRSARSAHTFAEKADLLRRLRTPHHFCHVHEECPHFRSDVGDRPAFRAGEVVPDPARILWRLG